MQQTRVAKQSGLKLIHQPDNAGIDQARASKAQLLLLLMNTFVFFTAYSAVSYKIFSVAA
jgi:hypothetical protein